MFADILVRPKVQLAFKGLMAKAWFAPLLSLSFPWPPRKKRNRRPGRRVCTRISSTTNRSYVRTRIHSCKLRDMLVPHFSGCLEQGVSESWL